VRGGQRRCEMPRRALGDVQVDSARPSPAAYQRTGGGSTAYQGTGGGSTAYQGTGGGSTAVARPHCLGVESSRHVSQPGVGVLLRTVGRDQGPLEVPVSFLPRSCAPLARRWTRPGRIPAPCASPRGWVLGWYSTHSWSKGSPPSPALPAPETWATWLPSPSGGGESSESKLPPSWSSESRMPNSAPSTSILNMCTCAWPRRPGASCRRGGGA
jgi:hypothetical protein